MSSDLEKIGSAISDYYKSEQTKDIKTTIKSIKSKRNLRNAYINYSQYIAEHIDKSISYTDYIAWCHWVNGARFI